MSGDSLSYRPHRKNPLVNKQNPDLAARHVMQDTLQRRAVKRPNPTTVPIDDLLAMRGRRISWAPNMVPAQLLPTAAPQHNRNNRVSWSPERAALELGMGTSVEGKMGVSLQCLSAPVRSGILSHSVNGGNSWEEIHVVVKDGKMCAYRLSPSQTGEDFLGEYLVPEYNIMEKDPVLLIFALQKKDSPGIEILLQAKHEWEYFGWIICLRGAKVFETVLRSSSPNLARITRERSQTESSPARHEDEKVSDDKTSFYGPKGKEKGDALLMRRRSGSFKMNAARDRAMSVGSPTSGIKSAAPPEETKIEKTGILQKYVHTKLPKLSGWKKRVVVMERKKLKVGKIANKKLTSSDLASNLGEIEDDIDLLFCQARICVGGGPGGKNYVFEVLNLNETITLGAETGAEMLEWVSEFQRVQAELMQSTLKRNKNREAEDEWKKILGEVMKDTKAGNTLCADCEGTETSWASISLGVFLCIECAGVHRGLGVDVSKVRSCVMDNECWNEEVVERMKNVGNAKSNLVWEAKLKMEEKIGPSAEREERKRFIEAKYVEKRWKDEDSATVVAQTVEKVEKEEEKVAEGEESGKKEKELTEEEKQEEKRRKEEGAYRVGTLRKMEIEGDEFSVRLRIEDEEENEG